MQGRIKEFFSRNRKTLYMILSIVLISIFSLIIGYAAMPIILNITDNAEVEETIWDVHLDNVKVNSGSVAGDNPIINGTTATFSTTLTTPGDFYEFTVDVVNGGTIDAMLDSIIKTPELTSEQEKYLNYIVEYKNRESINTKQLIKKKSFVRLKVRIEFKDEMMTSDLAIKAETLNLGFKLNYVKNDGSGLTVINNGLINPVAKGDINEIGTIVTIGTEQFYTIGTEDDYVKLLAMYNLHVGNEITHYHVGEFGYKKMPLINATGMQSELARGFSDDESHFVGTTAYSSDVQKGTNYSSYSGSIVEDYVNNYKSLLEANFDVKVEEARLISYAELTDSETFACKEMNKCSDKYPWIYSTSYWSGSADNSHNIWYVKRNGFFFYCDWDYDSFFGVRPVIVISKSQF